MRVVAICTGHLSLRQGHVRALPELHALLLMAGVAGLGDAGCLLQTGLGKFRHRVVTVAAAKAVGLVCRRLPENSLPALMALQANTVELLHRSAFSWGGPGFFTGLCRFPGEADDQRLIDIVFVCMPGTRTVAGFASLPLKVIFGVELERLGVGGMGELFVLNRVASKAAFLADVLGAFGKERGDFRVECIRCLGFLRCRRLGLVSRGSLECGAADPENQHDKIERVPNPSPRWSTHFCVTPSCAAQRPLTRMEMT